MPKNTDTNSDDATPVTLEVRSKGEKGFRRAGFYFGPDPVEQSFSLDAAQKIVNEPQLRSRVLSGGHLLKMPDGTEEETKAPAPKAPAAPASTPAPGAKAPPPPPAKSDTEKK